MVLGLDAAGVVLGIEMLDVRRRTPNPREMTFAMLAR
ncbi:MAG: hypothetical protein MUF16_05780 [Burkholderiaceae bacterium]|nr:hypothetical protein [Burkholderiaceae bacterium]